MVRDSTVSNNGTGLEAYGSGTTIRTGRSVITANGTEWHTDSGGVVDSYGDNNVDGNTTDGTPTNTIPTK